MRTAYVPWDSARDWAHDLWSLSTAVANLDDGAYSAEFVRLQLAALVFDVNRMEGTLSDDHLEGPTMRQIGSYLLGTAVEPAAVAWDAEGGRDSSSPSSERQLYQCAQAAKYLLVENVNAPLSAELMVRTHEIMMAGSVNRDRRGVAPVVVGRVRQDPSEDVNAGWYQFLPSRAVARAVDHLVSEYNDKASSGTEHPVPLATYLFYELITIHPFGNGNGRLCRLFLAWSLVRDGLPFPVSFSSGHSSRRQHYLHAINTARRPISGHRGELNVICLVSLENVLGNYLENTRLLQYGAAAAPR
jgi:Fic/DOC family